MHTELTANVLLRAVPIAEGGSDDDIALCLKIPVDRALRKPRRLGDIRHLGICNAVFCKAVKCFFGNELNILSSDFFKRHVLTPNENVISTDM